LKYNDDKIIIWCSC